MGPEPSAQMVELELRGAVVPVVLAERLRAQLGLAVLAGPALNLVIRS